MCSTLHLGGHRASAIVLLLHILPFYTSNWEEYCTGVMRFGLIGITEGQLFIIFLLAFTGVVGVDTWDDAIPIPAWLSSNAPEFLKPSFAQPMEAKFILVFVGTVGVLYQVYSSCMSVWEYHSIHHEERRTKKIYNKAKRMFAHHCLFLAGGISWIFAPSPFFAEHPRLVLLTIGTLFGYQVSRLIISRVTKDPYPFWFLNALFVPYFALIVNSWMGETLFNSYPVSIVYLALIYVAYAHFVVLTINQICDFLGIKCFKIVPKQTDPAAH
jgi:ethanolaminephosphotransferase